MLPPLLELGGRRDGILLHLACANGFPPEAYESFLKPFQSHYRVVAIPPRALWPGQQEPPPSPGSWWQLAEDLLAGLEGHHLGSVIGVGHSFGAVATMLAATREPSRFRALVMLDPTIFPPEQMKLIQTMRGRGEEVRFELIDGALKRKARFASPQEAFAYWRTRPLFGDWPDESLRHYVTSMLTPSGGGSEFELRWPRKWEAWYYRSFYPGTWDDLARLDAELPVLVVRGETSETFPAESETAFRAQRPDSSFAVVPGYGHLFPLAAPGLAAGVVQQWLDRLRPTVTA